LNEGLSSLAHIGVGAGILLLLALDLVLSIALVAVSTLSHVALRKLSSEAPDRLGFLEVMQEAHSPHRLASEIARQLCLVGAVLGLAGLAVVFELSWPHLLALACACAFVLLFENVLARSLALRNPRAVLRYSAVVVRFVRAALYPLAQPLGLMLQALEALQSQSDEAREEEQDEDVEALIEVGEREGLLEAEEGEMLRGIVDLDETRVREIMTPRTDIVAIPSDTTVAQARRTFIEAGHSRLPVFRDSIDRVVGVLHSRDLFRAWEAGQEAQCIDGFLRPVDLVPENSSARELLSKMRQRSHVALVLDEYGGVAGMVTLEDLLEEIVGDIRDEHDVEEEPIQQQSDGSWVVAAVTHVKELEALFDMEFEDREFDTVGGLVVFGFGRVPTVGERIETHGLDIQVLEADRRRVRQVRIRRLDDASAEVAG